MTAPRIVGLLVLALALVVATPAARADEKLSCDVVEIEASVTDTPSVDADLKDLAKKLRKMPFSAFNTFKTSARMNRRVTKLVSENFDTPHGAVDVIIRDIDKPSRKKKRVSLGVEVSNESGVRWVDTKGSIDAGDFMMFARTVSDTSSIVYAIGCR